MNSELDRGRFEGKVLEELRGIRSDFQKMGQRLDNHSKRLRALEIWRAGLAGVTAVVSAIVGWFVGWGK